MSAMPQVTGTGLAAAESPAKVIPGDSGQLPFMGEGQGSWSIDPGAQENRHVLETAATST